MSGTEKCPHALIVSSDQLGHVSGCMLLARALAALGFKVTFVYFSSYYASLKASNRLVLPYSTHTTEGGGPRSSQTSNGSISNGEADVANGRIELRVVDDGFAPGDLDKHFFVTPTMKENLFRLILELREQGMSPTCLVSDSFVPWTVHVAQRACIPRIDFWTSNAFAYLMIAYLHTLFSQGTFPETGSRMRWTREKPLMLDHIPGLPPFSAEMYPVDLRFADPSHPWVSHFSEVSSCLKDGERILIHTMPEIEVDALRAYQVLGVPAYGIGPLLQYGGKPQEKKSTSSQAEGQSGVHGQVGSVSWLDTQADSSVIFIAFGSIATLSAADIQELAFGLEASGSPFLWAIREDSLGGAELAHVLPEGFCERTSARGKVMGWAPQVEVLAHKAVGGFLTHCGWNSSLESLWEGVPLLCCAQLAEQRMNMHHLCNVWGVGLELERTETGGLQRSHVEVGVKALMQEEVGLRARGKAQEMMEIARKTCRPGGQSFGNLQKFYDDMKVLASKSMSHE